MFINKKRSDIRANRSQRKEPLTLWIRCLGLLEKLIMRWISTVVSTHDGSDLCKIFKKSLASAQNPQGK